MFRHRFQRAIAAAMVFGLGLTSVTFADQFQPDGDTLTTGAQLGAINLTLNAGASQTLHIGALINSSGSQHVSFPVPVLASIDSGAEILGTPSPESGSITAYGSTGEFKTDVVVTAPSTGLECDEDNQFKPGDMVWIEETKPISKLKRWIVIRGEHKKSA